MPSLFLNYLALIASTRLFCLLSFVREMLAVRTQALKVYGEVSNLEAGATHVGQWQSTKLRIVEINNLITANADQMVMTLGVAVKSSGTLEVLRSFGDSQFDQCFERPIDGRPRYAGDALFYICENLIDRRVIVTVNERAQNDSALHGHRDTSLSTRRLKEFQLLIFC
jgi:hypothetical protein